MTEENVILVDSADKAIGTMPKMEAHVEGVMHRAFSVFIFNSAGELLLQQRALTKYHSPGMWTNTCCSHPRPGEDTLEAAKRRINEEMGIKCQLTPIFSFSYLAKFENGLIEHEFDHVYFGQSDSIPHPNPQEVASFRYVKLEDLQAELQTHPEQFTPWLKICFEQVKSHYLKD